MREFLDVKTGELIESDFAWRPSWIEVPEGAEIYGYPPGSENAYFHKAVDGENWFYSQMTHCWSTSGHNVGEFDRVLWQRNPPANITEYLDPRDWSLKFVRPTDGAMSGDWIKVPEGAELYFRFSDKRAFVKFSSDDGAILWLNGKWVESEFWDKTDLFDERPERILWQRPTQPEELPFIDDEPREWVDDEARLQPFRQSIGDHVHHGVGGSRYEPKLPSLDGLFIRSENPPTTDNVIPCDGRCIEPPVHFVVRPKPRMRAYATLSETKHITVVLPAPVVKITINFSVSAE